MSTPSSLFTGASRYSNDFRAVIDRAVAIRSLSLSSLSSARDTLSSQSSALASLRSSFDGLANSLTNLQSSLEGGSLSSSISDGKIFKANVGLTALPGTYTIEVTSIGSQTNTISGDGLPAVADPSTGSISPASTLTLTIDGAGHDITPESNSLYSLAEAINNAGLDVQAAIVNLGGSGTPDYRLSLQSSLLGPVSISLSDGGANLLDTLASGTEATYRVNGLATEISTTSRSVTLAPGITIDLLSQSESGTAATLTVSRTTGSLGTALSSFATSYNAALGEIEKHRGEGAGALAGQALLSTLSAALRSVSSYNGSGDITSLDQIGLSFNESGRLVFDATTFASHLFNGLKAFLGSPTSGGFLGTATETLTALTSSTGGFFQTAQDSLTDQIKTQQSRIEIEQDRINSFRTDLEDRMAAADALIASLEQQVLYVQGLFSAYFKKND